MADGVSPPPNGPNGGLLLNVVRDWDGVAFGESEQEKLRQQTKAYYGKLAPMNMKDSTNWDKLFFS